MKNIIIIISITFILFSCKKRSNVYSFAGVWEITKVEQVSFVQDKQTLDSTLVNDTLGWFAFQNALGPDGQGKIQINFTSLSGLATDYATFWELSEHESDRIQINKKFYTREKIVGGEKWSWISSGNVGGIYNRETIFVKHK